MVFKTDYCLMQVKSIAECPKGSILQYFRPSLNNQLPLRSLFYLFLSGRFTHVLLYIAKLKAAAMLPHLEENYFDICNSSATDSNYGYWESPFHQ